MMATRREAERALREAGYSRSFAKQICDSGLPDYTESLTEDEKIELGLIKPKSSKYIRSLLKRADEFLN
jgi:hypothetical protein